LQNHLFLVPLYHIFGSEELSILSPGIAERAPDPYVAICTEDARELQLEAGRTLEFTVNKQTFRLPVKINDDITTGTAGLPLGLPGVPYEEIPAWAIILKQEPAWKNQAPIIS
jgi:NADH-quinone oxidoreductase subunit G